MKGTEKVPALVQQLYRVVRELKEMFDGRPFTLDGHLAGSLGEILVAERYGLRLYKPSSKTHDAEAPDGRKVQIKATQGRMVGLSSKPEHLIVVRLTESGDIEEVYNGPGNLVWEKAFKEPLRRQYPISVAQLRRLMMQVADDQKLPVISPGTTQEVRTQ